MSVLHIEGLTVSYRLGHDWRRAVRDFQITIESGQIYGLVGESGSGKTTIASAVMRYLPPNGRIEPGARVEFLDQDLLAMSPKEMQAVWADDLNLVPQNAGAALNPSLRIGEQIAEVIRQRGVLTEAQVREQVGDVFHRVNLPDPAGIMTRYPHQISGGQQQRVMIAMALITSPRLLILDEPTTSLDVTTEAAVLDVVENLIRQEQAGALYVTHNLGVIAQVSDRVCVLYGGDVMEDGPVDVVFSRPLHPYTIGLLNSIPRPGQTKRDQPLDSIPSRAPDLASLPNGCVYAPRCPLAIELCHSTRPPLETPEVGRLVRCHRWQEIASGEVYPAGGEETEAIAPQVIEAREQLLEVEKLTKHYVSLRTPLDVVRGVRPKPARAVEGVSLSVRQGRTYGLVGESGSGKTTLARMIVGLTDPTSGSISLMGADIGGNVRQRSQAVLARLQMIFQDPQNSLNPYHTIGESLRRPVIKLAGYSREAADREVQRLLQAVSLRGEYATRFPSELSGGEKQRVAIARAFASDPALIVCDEPVSSLDVSVQSSVLNLLARLQEERGTSYLFISHDLAVVGYLADYVAVMYLGEIFEVGYARDLFSPPLHPYTESLISAIPIPDPQQRTQRIHLSDDIPSPAQRPSGCVFHTRCPHKIGPICEQESPPWQDDGNEHFIRCHRTLDDLAVIQQYLLSGEE